MIGPVSGCFPEKREGDSATGSLLTSCLAIFLTGGLR